MGASPNDEKAMRKKGAEFFLRSTKENEKII
jgi:hypothetical protein